MTTGRINQVATNQKKWKPPLCSGNHFDVRNLCVWNFDCVLASVSQLSCTTAPLRRQHFSSKPSSSAARRTGSSAPAPWIEPQRYQVQVTCVVWMVEATIDPYNSKKSTGHPESEDEAYDEKAKKEKRTNDSLIKHLLDVT